MTLAMEGEDEDIDKGLVQDNNNLNRLYERE